MKTYIILLRGINVGGKNKMPMAGLRKCLEDLGCKDVRTYIASGNVILKSEKGAAAVKAQIERALPRVFKLDSELLKVLVLTKGQLEEVVKRKPKGFGDEPKKYHSDAIFLLDTVPAEAMKAFSPKEGVDKVWAGPAVIYSRRLSARRTESRLSKIASSPHYKAMTIRTWNTTTTLLKMLEDSKSNRC